MKKQLYSILKKIHSFYESMNAKEIRSSMKFCGDNVRIGAGSDITAERISVGNNTFLGKNTRIISTRADVKIGDDVMFGPGVTIVTGNHRTDLVGRTMISVRDDEKRPEDDEDVIIENDVWIGANVTILKGVTIGTGSIVAAGAVVTNSIPSYEMWGGVPARCIGKRFSEDVLQDHIMLLSKSEDKR